MDARLARVEIEDFKTYLGKHVVGPFPSFTAIMGRNGTGKSNFLDAVAFALGERATGLRVKDSRDLIHKKRTRAGTAAVTVTFSMERNKRQKAFTRRTSGSSSEYVIDGKKVPYSAYLHQLKEIGISTKCRNFVVFQGTVESIATRGSRKKTELLEEISGSGALSLEYQKLKETMERTEKETNTLFEKKNLIISEQKELLLDRKDSDDYIAVENEYEKKKLKLKLFQLYHLRKETKNLISGLEMKKKFRQELSEKKLQLAEDLKMKVDKQAKTAKEISAIDQDIRDLETNLNKKRTALEVAKERLAQMRKKEESYCKLLAKAEEVHQSHCREIEELEKGFNQVERKKAQYEADLLQESQTLGSSVELQGEQLAEYHRLKKECGQQCAPIQQALDSLIRDQKTDQDRLANAQRRQLEAEEAVIRKLKGLEEMRNRSKRLAEHEKQAKEALEEKRNIEKKLQETVTVGKNNLAEVETKLLTITRELNEASFNMEEAEKHRRKQETVEKLRLLYPGVYNRLGNMCQAIHSRYQLAIARVLMKHLNSIVVDTEETAMECLMFLKKKYLNRETFLPLNYLVCPPLRESIRELQDPKNGKLAFDLINFHPPEIRVAVLFATRNTIVCETHEDARRIVYEMGGGKTFSAVTHDGTLYSKNGLIYGGKLELEKKVQQWSGQNVAKLRSDKVELEDQLRASNRLVRQEAELNTISAQVRGLEARVKYTCMDLEHLQNQIGELEPEHGKIKDTLAACVTEVQEIETALARHEVEVTKIQMEMEEVEDEICTDFCTEVGVCNIRVYEEQGLAVLTEQANTRLNFEKQLSRIRSQLDFEKSRDTESSVTKWKTNIEAQETAINEAKKEEQRQCEKMKEAMQELAQKRSQKVDKGKTLRIAEEKVSKVEVETRAAAREMEKVDLKIISDKQKIGKNKTERYSILKQCKIDSTHLPLTQGSLKNVRDEPDTQETSTSTDVEFYDREIKVDFSSLSNTAKRINTAEEKQEAEERLKASLRELKRKLSSMHPPEKNLEETLKDKDQQLRACDVDLYEKRLHATRSKQDFENIRKERYNLFMKCYTSVLSKIDEIYKALCQSTSAQALLEIEKAEEPYLGAIIYHCVPSGKRVQSMWNLSGGEKTMASLAFLFALHSYHAAPFFLLDEIDAALDITNLNKITHYFIQQREQMQTIVISHKPELQRKADVLYGITCHPRDPEESYIESCMFSLDLSQFSRYKRKHRGPQPATAKTRPRQSQEVK